MCAGHHDPKPLKAFFPQADPLALVRVHVHVYTGLPLVNMSMCNRIFWRNCSHLTLTRESNWMLLLNTNGEHRGKENEAESEREEKRQANQALKDKRVHEEGKRVCV